MIKRLLAKRQAMGWSIKEAAQYLEVDEGTWGGWKRGGVVLYRNHWLQVTRLFGLHDGEVNQGVRVRRNRIDCINDCLPANSVYRPWQKTAIRPYHANTPVS